MEITENPTSVFVIAVLVAVVCQIASSKMRFPPIFLWLLAGMALGPYGIHILHPEMVKPALHTLIELGLAVILFEGGLNLNLKSLKEHGWVVGRLLTFGPLLTIAIGGAAAHLLTGISWPLSLLFGALIAVGGPTVITPILRQVRLDREVAHILSSEAMLVDAVGAILAIVMLQVVLVPDPTVLSTIQAIVVKFSIGAAFGFAGGWLLSRILKSSIVDDIEVRTVFTLAAVWGLFLLADGVSSQTGLLAVLIAGATMQKMELPDIQRLRHFKGSLSILLVSVLFVLLASNLNLGIVKTHLWEGLLLFMILALIARPLGTWLAATGSELTAPQVWFLAGMAPRGVVAAGITSLFVIILIQAGYKEAEILLALVYIIIIASVFVYSFLASPLAHRLKVTGRDERSVLIVGGGQMGAELGRVLAAEREVRFLDLNADVVNNLKRANFQAVCGNALDPIYMEILHTEEVSAVLAMTGSSDHNLLIANLARDTFHVSEVYVALQEDDEIKHASMIRQLQARRLFAKPYTFSYWHDQALRKRLMHETRTVSENSELIGHRMADARIPHGIQPLAVCRDGKMLIPYDDLRFEAGDEISLLLRPERIQEGQALVLPPASDNSMVITKKPA
ncbi:MAG: cation:proton antiporter [Mariprofundaceae bacterium]|nr:cation:proton antiporter [Mariprofundaceae bacterium]